MSGSNTSRAFSANGIAYAPRAVPSVAICLDGSSDEYLDAAMARGRMPVLSEFARTGYRGLARAAMPTFTNVNNTSIVTGVPPAVHGIGGNFFYDVEADCEVMMNASSFVRAETIFAAARKAGRRVGVVTAKEKLRDIFAAGLVGGENGGIAFSSEKADQARSATHGIEGVEALVGAPKPAIYSAEASLYVLWAGAALLRNGLADLLYLSTTDYMQHKFAPDQPESLEFYARIDEAIGVLVGLGAVVAVTADHGMNAKQRPDGTPNVVYLESELEQQFGKGFRVILPITDPYVVHHGALGSFAVIHIPPHTDPSRVREFLWSLSGVTEVHDRMQAARLLELPADRLGEFVVASGRNAVLGRTPAYHDLSALEGGLRSHGGRYEEMVPFLFSTPLKPAYASRAAGDPRNFHIFDFLLNGTVGPGPGRA